VRRALARAVDRISIYLPILLMGLLALGSYWLVRQSPVAVAPHAAPLATHDPDYFMRDFSVRTFHASGRLKSEIFGKEARHYPDNDTLEIDQPIIRSFNEAGKRTVATANRALSNGDASEVQLFGNAVVKRDPTVDAKGQTLPGLEFRGEFLHAFMRTERVRSHQPVELKRGADRFTADALDYDNLERAIDLRGRVRGLLVPRASR
jgi:lipopolysaccharide export system protein LptC